MQLHTKYSLLTSCVVATLASLLIASSAFAAELLRIQPIKYDCGVVNEGVAATMRAVVENISKEEIHVSNVKVN
jgi:hypothetical protein